MCRLVLLILSAVAFCTVAAQYRRVCYYTNWAQYRSGVGKFTPENVDPNICTHIIYAFAKLVGNQLIAFEWNDESTTWMKGMYARFAALKDHHPTLKLLLAVGGWNMGSGPFVHMVASDTNRREFSRSAVAFLRNHGFDGLDMDWEYPANRGSTAQDRDKYTALLQTLHDEFAQENIPAGKDRLMLTAAVSAGKDKIDTGYDIPEISKYLDMINLMTYDLHGSWDDHTGHHAGLFARAGETGNNTYLNVDWASQYWVQNGAPRAKINIGLALYGRSFKLPWHHTSDNVGCPADGAGQAGPHTSEAGFLAYYEICEKLANGATKGYINDQRVPYMVQGDLWVGYDDPDSLKIKVDYIKQQGFGGIMVWALDLDDFSDACGQGKYPLMQSVIQALNAAGSGNPVFPPIVASIRPTPVAPIATFPPTYQPIPHITTTTQQTSYGSNSVHQFVQVSSNEFDCHNRSDGYYESPYSCQHYYICARMLTFKSDCHSGLLFNRITLYCDFPYNVYCNIAATAISYTTSAAVTLPPVVTANNFCQNSPDGYYSDPHSCSSYYKCTNGNAVLMHCQTDTYFSPNLQVCVWAFMFPICH